MPVINTIELEGVSDKSWGDAAREALGRVDICARTKQHSYHFCLVRCGRNVQCRVARPDISPNWSKVESLGRLTSRSRLETYACQGW